MLSREFRNADIVSHAFCDGFDHEFLRVFKIPENVVFKQHSVSRLSQIEFCLPKGFATDLIMHSQGFSRFPEKVTLQKVAFPMSLKDSQAFQ